MKVHQGQRNAVPLHKTDAKTKAPVKESMDTKTKALTVKRPSSDPYLDAKTWIDFIRLHRSWFMLKPNPPQYGTLDPKALHARRSGGMSQVCALAPFTWVRYCTASRILPQILIIARTCLIDPLRVC